ncbi:protein of unknown function [Desulfonauticus submarinus]|uniref:DUF4340 domain-containing protein n=1 Tax=Desulfonauticus submarinus TaxID=206665 RepID=A0A1H0B5E0_9BACT|nr:DUF4340 domain-containing protein [Desulfonauticus submarinus]SDN40792.1 protein of unknown function [Desulfonauticus submarinus]
MKRIWILCIVAVLVWIGVYWGDKATKKEQLQWPNFSKQRIDQIVFPNFSLLKKENKWWVKKADKLFPANSSEIEALFRFLTQNRLKRIVGTISTKEWTNFGLKETQKIVIKGDKFNFSLIYGDENPTKDGIYALTSLFPNKLILLPWEYKTKFKGQPKEFYQLHLFSFQDEDILRLKKFENKSLKWEIKRIGSSSFVFANPPSLKRYKVSVSEATSLFFNLASLQGTDFVVDPDKPKLLFTLEYTLKDYSKGKLYILKSGQTFLAKCPQKTWYYILDQSRVDSLNKDAFLLRDRHFLSLDEDNVNRVEIYTPTKDISIYRKEKSWYELSSNKEFYGLNLILWELKDLEYTKISHKREVVKGTKKLVLILKDAKNKELLQVSFWPSKEAKDRFWVKVRGRDDIYLVETDLVQEVQNRLKDKF